MVIPKARAAIQMYGPWIKNDTCRSNCFSMAGKGVTRTWVDQSECALNSHKMARSGSWHRRQPRGLSVRIRGVLLPDRLRRTGIVPLYKIMSLDRVAGNYGNSRIPIPSGPNYLDLPSPDFAKGGNGKVLDVGPSTAQSLEIPYFWVYRSQRAHNYPDEIPITWPTNNPELQELVLKLYGHETLIFNSPKLSELITHMLGTRKRKSHTWYNPDASPIPGLDAFLSLDPESKFSRGSDGHGTLPKRKEHNKKVLGSGSHKKQELWKTKVSTDSMTAVLNRIGFLNHCCIPAMGIAGGFCIAWRMGVKLNIMDVFELGFKANITKQDLKIWNVNKFGFCDKRLKELKHILGLIQSAPVLQKLVFSVKRRLKIHSILLRNTASRVEFSSIEFSSMKPKLDLTLDGKVDASVLGSEAGIAAILKSDGVWSEAFAALNFIHVSSMLEGELAAISLALTAAKNKGFDKISIESDCSAEIRGLNSGSFPIGWGYPIFSECLVKIKDFVSVDFIYINRSIKSFTDLLAHGACVEKIHAFGCIREVAPFVVTTLC
ncbi:hypothetical protein G4B88_021865 [Cannabis sativa]|uniref:RNase H type-1 domain-containing protein n=1 Tax=Cannabis sativa TaxID=3483 RepID=A0A7J6H1A5_CANSA|nr:hypothetical protein G4B88_021865 [Cannabis sativa]